MLKLIIVWIALFIVLCVGTYALRAVLLRGKRAREKFAKSVGLAFLVAGASATIGTIILALLITITN